MGMVCLRVMEFRRDVIFFRRYWEDTCGVERYS